MSIEKCERNPNERIYLSQFLDVLDQHSDEQLGFLSDFSTGGMMFITNLPIALNETMDVYIKDNIEDEEIAIKAQIQTIWSKPNLNRQMTCIGCRFLSIDDENRQLLENLGKKLTFGADVEIIREIDE